MRILVIDDDFRVLQLLVASLSRSRLEIECASSVVGFAQKTAEGAYDAFIVDLGLPDGSGLDVVREIRGTWPRAPVLVISGRSSLRDKVAALGIGADDYIVKPFHVVELIARLKAISRRIETSPTRRLSIGQVEYDTESKDIRCRGRPVILRRSEHRLLTLLIEHHGRLVSREMIENSMQSSSDDFSPNAVDQLVSRLRRQIESQTHGLRLRTVKGLGYVLENAAGEQ